MKNSSMSHLQICELQSKFREISSAKLHLERSRADDLRKIEKLTAERDNALAQNAELVAQVEALGDKLSEVVSLLDVDGMTAVQWLLDNCQDIESLLEFEPEQHLRERDAEVLSKFIEFMHKSSDCQLCEKSLEIASQYAERVKAGEK